MTKPVLRDVSSPIPDPPYSSEIASKGWRFEIDYERLRNSDTWALLDPTIRPWWTWLFLTAWGRGRPTGSLPSDPDLICAHSGMPRALFSEHRDILMRGWYQCSDGRLYHPVITEFVIRMEASRSAERDRKAKWRESRKNINLSEMSHGTGAGLTREGRHQNQNQNQNQNLKDYSPIGELSGKPDPSPPEKHENPKTRELRKQAAEVLDYLNSNTGKSFKRVDANLDMIVARLKEGYTPVELKEIAFFKTREWGADEKMAEYLRPKTLYNRTNCAQYHGEHCQSGGGNEVS